MTATASVPDGPSADKLSVPPGTDGPVPASLPSAPTPSVPTAKLLAGMDHVARDKAMHPDPPAPVLPPKPVNPPRLHGVLAFSLTTLAGARPAPAGVQVRVDLGDTPIYDVTASLVVRLAWLIEEASDVEIVGSDPRTIEQVVRGLRTEWGAAA